jgi:hypothetical protein
MQTNAAADAAADDAAPWTKAEVDAVLEVRRRLLEKGVPPQALGERELIAITLNSKCRVDEAVTKFETYRNDLLLAFGVDDVWANFDELHDHWHRLAVAGRDEGDRGIMWINGGATPVAEEERCIRACTLYFFAVHADRRSLREGITMVINTARQGDRKKVGNEKKLQVAWQNYPTRPQHIFILGTSAITRVVINGLIAFASLFAKNKVIARIEFSSVDKVGALIGTSSLPEQHGGVARPSTAEFVRARLASFPLMGLPPLEGGGPAGPVVAAEPMDVN